MKDLNESMNFQGQDGQDSYGHKDSFNRKKNTTQELQKN